MKLKFFDKAEADFAHAKQLKTEQARQASESQKRYAQPIEESGFYAEMEAKIQQFTTAISSNPNDAEAWYKRGEAYYEKRDCEAVIKDFSTAIRLNRKYAVAYAFRAACFEYLCQYKKALRDFDKALSLDLKNGRAYQGKANILRQLGETEMEIAVLEKKLEFFPDDKNTIQDISDLYVKTAQYEKAIEYQTRFLPLETSAYDQFFFGTYNMRGSYQSPKIRELSAALEKEPENAVFYFFRGKFLDMEYHFKEAVSDYTEAIRRKPDFLLAYIYRALANGGLLRRTTDTTAAADFYKKMIADYSQALQLANNLAFIHWELGRCYKETGKYKPAVSCFKKTLKLNPQYLDAYLSLYETYDVTGSYQQALDALTSYMGGFTTYTFNNDLIRRADLFCKMGEYFKALKDYNTAIEMEQEFRSFSLPVSLRKRGKCYQALRDEEKAQIDFAATAELQKKDW